MSNVFQSDLLDEPSKYNALSATPPANNHSSHNSRHNFSLSQPENVTTGLSFSNPVYELSNPSAGESTLETLNQTPDSVPTTSSTPPTANSTSMPNVAFKVEHVLSSHCASENQSFGSNFNFNFRLGLHSRWRVAHAIYPYMVCIALAYCVTLSLYPGIESEIISCNLKSWMPVLLMFTFNTCDVIGKVRQKYTKEDQFICWISIDFQVMASFPYPWSRRQLILLSTMRIALVPLLLLCCTPRTEPIIAGETPAFIFTAALGITNGLAGSLPMMLAPTKVPSTLKEITGNMMTLSYNVGLTAGSLIGYVFDSLLGPPIVNPCPKYPYIPMPPSMLNITTTTARTTKAIITVASTTTAATTKLSTILSSTTSTTTLPPTTIASSTQSNVTNLALTTLATLLTTLATAKNTTLADDLIATTIQTPLATSAVVANVTHIYFKWINSVEHWAFAT